MNRLENENTTLLNEFNTMKSSFTDYGMENSNGLCEMNLDDIIDQMKSKQKELKDLKLRINEIFEESKILNNLYESYNKL